MNGFVRCCHVKRIVHRQAPIHIVFVIYALILIALRGGMNPLHFTLASSVFLLAASLWVYRQRRTGAPCCPPRPAIVVPLLAAWAIAFIQCFRAIVFVSAIEEVWKWAVFLLCFLMAASTRKRPHPGRILFVFTIMLGLLCAHVFLEAATGWRMFGIPGNVDYLHRPGSVYYNPNHLANLIVILTPFLLTAMGSPLLGRWRFAAYGLPLGLGFIAMVFTQSRSGMIALFCALAIWLWVKRPGKWVWLRLAVGVLVCTTVAWCLLGQASRRHFAQRMGAWARNDRLTQLWPATTDMIRAKPWWGWGPGSFIWVYPSYDRHLSAIPLRRTHAHNDFLELIAQSGLVGGVAIGGLVLFAWRRGFRATTRRERLLLAAGAASAGGMLMQSAFDFTLYVPANVVVLAVLLGVACRGLRSRAAQAPHMNKEGLSVLAPGAYLAGAICGIVLWANSSIMEYALRRQPSGELHPGGLMHRWISLNPIRDWRAPWIQSRSLPLHSGGVTPAATDCEAADRVLNKTLRLNPCFIPAYHSLVQAQFACGKTREAFATLGQGLARFPKDFGLWFQKALAERERNLTAKAIASFRQAMVLSNSEQMSELIRRDLVALGAPAPE